MIDHQKATLFLNNNIRVFTNLIISFSLLFKDTNITFREEYHIIYLHIKIWCIVYITMLLFTYLLYIH